MTAEEHDALRDAARRLMHKELAELQRARDVVDALHQDVHRLAVGLIEIAAQRGLQDALDDIVDLYACRDPLPWWAAEVAGTA
jgi:hypothetical protein